MAGRSSASDVRKGVDGRLSLGMMLEYRLLGSIAVRRAVIFRPSKEP